MDPLILKLLQIIGSCNVVLVPPEVTSYVTAVHYQSKETDISAVHRPRSNRQVYMYSLVRVCMCV